MGTYTFIADPKTKFPRSRRGFPPLKLEIKPRSSGYRLDRKDQSFNATKRLILLVTLTPSLSNPTRPVIIVSFLIPPPYAAVWVTHVHSKFRYTTHFPS